MQPCLTCMLSKKYTLQVRRYAMLYSGKAANCFQTLILFGSKLLIVSKNYAIKLKFLQKSHIF